MLSRGGFLGRIGVGTMCYVSAMQRLGSSKSFWLSLGMSPLESFQITSVHEE